MSRRKVETIWIDTEDKEKFESHMKYADTQAAKFHDILECYEKRPKCNKNHPSRKKK